jgi:hypothetical protein
MNLSTAMKIKITSYLSKPTTKYLIEVPETATIFQIKQEIEKLEKISADWIILHHTARYGEVKDDVTITNSRIDAEYGLRAEFRYKFDECPPMER